MRSTARMADRAKISPSSSVSSFNNLLGFSDLILCDHSPRGETESGSGQI